MKLQISFDIPDLEKSIDIAKKVIDFTDVLEIGTILIHKYGIEAVEAFKEQFPTKKILVDTKIIDRGKDIVTLYAKTDVDWVTVMAGTSNNVIHRVCTEAQNHGIDVMLDMVDSTAPGQSALEAKNLGVDAILFHQAYDEKESLVFLDNLDMVQGNTDLPIFISAKINRENIDKILDMKPQGIVVGKSITEAKDPEKEAKFFYNVCCKV